MSIDKYIEDLRNDISEANENLEIGNKTILDLAGNEEEINKLIDNLSDENQSAEEKNHALHKLNAISIFSDVLPTKMPEYINALRGLLDAENPDIRLQAFSTLSAMKDEYAQEKLTEILNSDTKEEDKSIPTHNAIAMLGFDEKAVDHKVLKKIVKDPPNHESLVQAIRHLEADEETFEILKDIMEDESKPIEARSMVPEIINTLNPSGFLNSVQKMLDEQGGDTDMVPFLARGIAGLEELESEGELEETKDKMRNIIDKASLDTHRMTKDILFDKDDK